jgi:hypothetical protein
MIATVQWTGVKKYGSTPRCVSTSDQSSISSTWKNQTMEGRIAFFWLPMLLFITNAKGIYFKYAHLISIRQLYLSSGSDRRANHRARAGCTTESSCFRLFNIFHVDPNRLTGRKAVWRQDLSNPPTEFPSKNETGLSASKVTMKEEAHLNANISYIFYSRRPYVTKARAGPKCLFETRSLHTALYT